MLERLKHWFKRKSEIPIDRDQIESVLKISQNLLTSLYQFDRERVWNSVAEQIRDLYDCELVTLFLVDETDRDHLVIKAQCPYTPEESANVRIKIQSKPKMGLTAHVAASMKPAILGPGDINSNRGIGEYIANRQTTHLKSGSCYSALLVPLINRKEELVGVLGLNNKATQRQPKQTRFKEADKANVEHLAVDVVALLENAHAFDALRSLVSDIQSAESRDEAIDCILNNAVSLLNARHAKLGLLSSDKKKLVYAGGKNLRDGQTPEKGEPINPKNLMVALWNSTCDGNNDERGHPLNEDIWLDSGPLQHSDWTRCVPGAQSSISTIIRAHDQAVGVLHLESEHTNYFDELDGQLLKALAQNVTTAIQSINKPWPTEPDEKKRLSLGEEGGLYRSVVDNIPLVMWRKDEKGRFKWVNPAFCEIIKTPEAEISDKDDFELFPKYAEIYRRGDEIAMREGNFEDEEEPYEVPETGKKSVIHVFKTAIYDHRRNVIGTQGVFLDVTGDKYRELFEVAPVGFVELDQAGKISHVNEAVLKTLGYGKKSEMLEKEFSYFSNNKPVLDKIVSGLLKASTQDKSVPPTSGEEEMQHLVNLKKENGTILPVSIATRRVRDSAKMVTGLLCVVQEIRAGVEIEEALRDPDSRYLAKIKELSIPVFQLNRNLRVKFVNNAYLKHGEFAEKDVLGKTTEEIYTSRIYKNLDPEQEKQFKEQVTQFEEDNKEVLKNGTVLDKVELNPRKKGGHTIVRVLKFPVKNAKDEIIGVQAVFWEHQKQTDAINQLSDALKQAREEYRTIVQEAGEGIFQSEIDGTIIAANPAMVDLMGYESEEALLENAAAGVKRFAIKDELTEYFQQLNDSEPHRSLTIDYDLRKSETEVVRVSETVQKVVNLNERERLVGFAENINYRREEAEKRENMVMMLAHQLRGPAWQCFERLDAWVRILDPHGQDLNDRPSPDLIRAAMARGLARKTRGVAWSIDMLSELAHSEKMDLAKHSPKFMSPSILLKLAREAASDTQLVMKASAGFKERMGKKTSIPDFIPSVYNSQASHRRLYGCAKWIEQIVDCLIDNAFKYSKSGGKIKIHLAHYSNTATVSVKNQPPKGLEMDYEATKRCREKEWRTAGAKLCDADGNGLGLYLVDRIMEAHGGKLLVYMTDKDGWNEFGLQFPLKANQKE